MITLNKDSGGKAVNADERQAGDFRYWSPWLLVFIAAWAVCYWALAPAPVELFASNWIYIPLGFFAAILGNISAIGGGIVFIPAMMLLFHLNPVTALKTALGSQCFGMTSGAIGWMQKKVVPLKLLRLTVPGLLIGSTIGSLVIQPSPLLVKLFFGPVSILLGLVTIVMARRKGGKLTTELPDHARWPVIITSIIGGMITGWVAIGEGELVAALLMLVFGLEVTACIGLGVVLLAINSLYLTAIHSMFLGGMPWDIVAFTGLGCVFGARLAPYISKHCNPMTLKIIFATIAIGDGILFVVQYMLASGH